MESMLLSESQFNTLMTSVDDTFDEALVRLHQRPLRAVVEAFKRLNISGEIIGPSKQPANYPITTQNLSSHVTKWYDDRYGDALKIDMSIGRFPFQLKGIAYACKLPLFYGSFKILACKENIGSQDIINVFDLLENLPSYVREKSTNSDEKKLILKFEIALKAIIAMQAKKENSLINSALSDALVSCDQITSNKVNYSLSAWHSLQFAEKVLKFYISRFEAPQFTHEVKKLKNKAKNLGYIDSGNVNWDSLDFKPAIRYEPNGVSQRQALEANMEAWKVAYETMEQLKDLQ
ncbi:hypothetical protein [Vibrio alginolyticus]|uniref:hypothetical protein n=1 Tax=Vibrio alginolyticus TaxID=663 RepID=UPI0025579B6D|nr:hypothetical protein [Vibrio alginolyticus]MDL0446006.1 hypothetical protein [Vibrio alginolyticus]